MSRLALLAAVCAVAAVPAAHATPRSLTRNYEPVVLTGAQLAGELGGDVTKMVAFRYTESSNTWTQIPFQIDEKTPGGSYFSADDGVWDSNDEFCFLAQDAGDKAPSTSWPAGVNQTTRDEVQVADPLTGNLAWAYVCTAPSVTPVSTQYVTYSGTTTNQTTGKNASGGTNYVIDFVDGAPQTQSVMAIGTGNGGDGTDLVDRAKTRAKVLFLWYTEDDVVGTIAGTKLGPVRLIERITGKLTGFDALDATAFYYSDFIRTATTIISTFFSLNELRYSVDFNNVGLTHYDDHGVNGGNGPLPVDGIADAFSAQPLGRWWEVDSAHGCYILISDFSGAPAQTVKGFYQDGGSDPSGKETGASGIRGESGVDAFNAQSTTFSVDYWSFMLPANQGNVGNTYEGYYQNPLAMTVASQSYVVGVGAPDAASVAALGAATPSPFRGATRIPVQLAARVAAGAAVQVATPSGRVVRTLPLPSTRPGATSVSWDGRDARGVELPAGIYLYRLVGVDGAARTAGKVMRVR